MLGFTQIDWFDDLDFKQIEVSKNWFEKAEN